MNFFSHKEQLKIVRKNAVARASIKESLMNLTSHGLILGIAGQNAA